MSYAPTKLAVPIGFEEILTAFAKDVLKRQPGNIYEHAAAYFRSTYVQKLQGAFHFGLKGCHALVRMYRSVFLQVAMGNNRGHARFRLMLVKFKSITWLAVWVVLFPIAGDFDSVEGERDNDSSEEIDLEDPAVEDAAVQIQSAYRGHLARKATRQARASLIVKWDFISACHIFLLNITKKPAMIRYWKITGKQRLCIIKYRALTKQLVCFVGSSWKTTLCLFLSTTVVIPTSMLLRSKFNLPSEARRHVKPWKSSDCWRKRYWSRCPLCLEQISVFCKVLWWAWTGVLRVQ